MRQRRRRDCKPVASILCSSRVAQRVVELRGEERVRAVRQEQLHQLQVAHAARHLVPLDCLNLTFQGAELVLAYKKYIFLT